MRAKINKTYLNNYIMTNKPQKINFKQLIKDEMILTAINNALNLGWLIKSKSKNTLIFEKKTDTLTSLEHNTETLINLILNLN